MRTLRRLLAMLALLGALAVPAEARWLLAPRGAVQAGQSIDIDVLIANDGVQPLPDELIDRLPARLRSGDRSIAVTLEAAVSASQAPSSIAPGAFRARSYRLVVPDDFSGTVQLELVDRDARVAMVAAPKPAIAPVAVAPAPAPMPAKPAPAEVARDADADPRPPALSTHEPMYFIVGTRETTSAKLQLSFKYRFFDEESVVARWFAPLGKLHFGYTQSSIWDIGKDSAPFRDTSYRPSFFYFEPNVWSSSDGGQRLSLSAGVEHESNGKDGLNSRSLNTAFLWPRWRANFGHDNYLVVWPKLVYYIEKSDNADVQRYRGYGQLNVRVGNYDGIEASTTWRKGTSTAGSVQLDLSYPIRRRFFANAGGYIYLQYFNGYGESLLDYDVKRRSQVRLGFAISR
jgi:outer membrane phospholipase A